MNQASPEQQCHCECGKSEFTVKGKPLMRMFCHCTICQEFNNAAFADVTLFLSKDVEFDRAQPVDFKKYKSPPAVDRGKCQACGKPVIEFLDMPLFPALTIIPSKNIAPGEYLPESCGHIFYHRRVEDSHDALPKCSGPIKSQLFLGKKLFQSMLSR